MNEAQKQKLMEYWKIYGNGGPKHTIGNHKLIQKLIFTPNVDFETCLKNYQQIFLPDGGVPHSKAITEECIEVVKKVLEN
jgi:hypothetical protein